MSAHDLSVSLFVRGLTNLKRMLDKGEQHAASRGIPPAELLSAQLASNMQSLGSQVHWTGEAAKRTVDRLLGAEPTPPRDDASSFAELQQRLDTTIAYLRGLPMPALEAGLERTIEIEHRRGLMTFTGDRFLREFAIPHFYFHFTNAYAILSHHGVELNMGDFLGSFG